MNALSNSKLKPRKLNKRSKTQQAALAAERQPSPASYPGFSPSSPQYSPYSSTDRPYIPPVASTSRVPDALKGVLGISASTLAAKVSKKHLALKNPEGKTSSLRAQRKAKQKAEKEKILKAKVRGYKVRGLVPKPERRVGKALDYATAEGLRCLWLGYISEVLGLSLEGGSQGVSENEGQVDAVEERVDRYHALQQGFTQVQVQGWHTKLVKADYHGALIKVKESTNVSIVGMQGIIIQETEGTWSIVTRKNAIKVLPKHGTIFTLTLALKSTPDAPKRELNFDLSGNQFSHKDRVGRKWKASTLSEFSPDMAMYF